MQVALQRERLVEVREVTKYYGDFLAVEDVSFDAYRGEILGLLGANGSGKTTTMRIITGSLPPTSGVARVCGFDVGAQSLEARASVGYMPESVPLYADMSVTDFLGFAGEIHGLRGGLLKERIEDALAATRLQVYRRTLIRKLSKGYRQRVGLAQAILHRPSVVVLDEPTNSIDPIQVVEIRELIRRLGEECAVILSTHVLAEASALCDRVAIMHEGVLLAVASVAELGALVNLGERVEIEVEGPAAEVLRALEEVPGVEDVAKRGAAYVVRTSGGAHIREHMVRMLVEHGWPVASVSAASVGLEEVFTQLTESSDARSSQDSGA